MPPNAGRAPARPRRFDPRPARDAPSVAVVKKVTAAFLGVQLVLATLSGYRAWVQVRRLDLAVAERVLREGSPVRADVVTSGRTVVDVRLELAQGEHVESLAARRVERNRDAASDPRSRRASLAAAVTPELLGRFRPGPAVVRATARGRPQWLRVPPPTVREVPVEIPPPP